MKLIFKLLFALLFTLTVSAQVPNTAINYLKLDKLVIPIDNVNDTLLTWKSSKFVSGMKISTLTEHIRSSISSGLDLQAVTDNGATTTNPVEFNDTAKIYTILDAANRIYLDEGGITNIYSALNIFNVGDEDKRAVISGVNLDQVVSLDLPNTNGTFAISVNSTSADVNGNIELSVVTEVNDTFPNESGQVYIDIPFKTLTTTGVIGAATLIDEELYVPRYDLYTDSQIAATPFNTLTTAGTSGAATLSLRNLNIPRYDTYADGKVADAINDGTTTIAPSQNAVFDALALKQNAFTASTADYVRGNGSTANLRTSVIALGLTGLTTGTNTPISGSNSIITAFADLQAQITAQTPRQLKDFYTDVQNSGTTDTDLYSYTLPANTLTANGQKLSIKYSLEMNDTAVTSYSISTFSRTDVFTPPTQINTIMVVEHDFIRTSSTTARIVTKYSYGNTTTPFLARVDDVSYNFTISNTILLRGQVTGGSATSGDLIAKTGNIVWHPAAP